MFISSYRVTKFAFQNFAFGQPAKNSGNPLERKMSPESFNAQVRAMAEASDGGLIYGYLPTYTFFPENYQNFKGYNPASDASEYGAFLDCGRMDRQECAFVPSCGNDSCDAGSGETAENCPWDCG